MTEGATGNIYDLGYQRYTGARLGRRHAIWALYRESLRAAFGLGRRAAAKVAPAVLILIALAPALLQVIGGLLGGGENMEIVRHDQYYGMVAFIVALYVAVIAPDIFGREQRDRTVALFFTRAVSREDFVLARFLALVTAMLLVTLAPQLVMFVGNALVADSFGDHLRANADQLLPIAGTALLGSTLIASVGAAIAAQTPQRAFATVGIVAAFLVTVFISLILVESIGSLPGRLAVFVSPFAHIEGSTAWMFRSELGADSVVARSGFHLYYFPLAAVILTSACYGLLLGRYRRLQP
ncbi:MAG: ABC transporter permease [Dehalococcoidia bacterium]